MKFFLFSLLFVFSSLAAQAEQDTPVDYSHLSSFPSVADNMKSMDQDKDGIVTAEEITQYLQAQHGRNYKQSVLDELQRVSNSRSCGSPFSRSVY